MPEVLDLREAELRERGLVIAIRRVRSERTDGCRVRDIYMECKRLSISMDQCIWIDQCGPLMRNSDSCMLMRPRACVPVCLRAYTCISLLMCKAAHRRRTSA